MMRLLLIVFVLIWVTAQASAIDLTVISFNVESDRDTNPEVVANVMKKITTDHNPHIWGLSEVRARDFETYRKAAGSNFKIIKGLSGRADRLAIVYDPKVLTQIEVKELSAAGGSRHPLMAKFKLNGSQREFYFVVNHLQRGKSQVRQNQARWLNKWVQNMTKAKDKPAIVFAGDYNFDVDPDTKKGNKAFDLFMLNKAVHWIEPPCIAQGDCPETGTGCDRRYNSILDFVFLAGNAFNWKATSEILFKDDSSYCGDERTGGSDHRPVKAVLKF